MRIKNLRDVTSALGLLTLISCITVNIYFPEAAVKKTAEEIVNEIRDTGVKDEKQPEEKKQEEQPKSVSWIPAALAQQETTVSTPGIRNLKESIKQRFPRLGPYFDKGRLGEANDGLVQIRDEKDLPLAEKAALRKLVKDENADRQALYAEVAKAMGIDAGQVARIQKIFAEEWAKNSKPGWWIQNANGQWVQKP